MEQESEGSTFGMALQLKDLFWSAESFDAGEAMEKEETHRLGSPSNQLQAEADSNRANDSAGKTP